MMNSLKTLVLLLSISSLTFLESCNESIASNAIEFEQSHEGKVIKGNLIPNITKEYINSSSITSLFEDSEGNLWIGTEREGICKYDGERYIYYSMKMGLCDNHILSIQEDEEGVIWFQTSVGLCRFDEDQYRFFFIDTDNISATLDESIDDWKSNENDIWFKAGLDGQVFRYDGEQVTRLTIPFPANSEPKENLSYNPYWVFSIHKALDGGLWMGTISGGVVKFTGSDFEYINNKDLGQTVMSIYEDKNGEVWFGNNGAGAFQFNENGLSNFSNDHGVADPAFLENQQVSNESGFLSRVSAIIEDDHENIWFGTLNSGVWKYDGIHLTNYSKDNSFPSNRVNSMIKDQSGRLWIGSPNGMLIQYDGTSFTLLNSDTISIIDGC